MENKFSRATSAIRSYCSKKPLESLTRMSPPDESDIMLVEIYGIRPK